MHRGTSLTLEQRRTLQQPYAKGPVMILWGWVFLMSEVILYPDSGNTRLAEEGQEGEEGGCSEKASGRTRVPRSRWRRLRILNPEPEVLNHKSGTMYPDPGNTVIRNQSSVTLVSQRRQRRGGAARERVDAQGYLAHAGAARERPMVVL